MLDLSSQVTILRQTDAMLTPGERTSSREQALVILGSFSRSGLIDQLQFEGFSQAEAEYGVNTTGL